MGKTSFKTHDPFVILEHLDGKVPVHLASLLICIYLNVKYQQENMQRTGFEGLISWMIGVHSFCIISQIL